MTIASLDTNVVIAFLNQDNALNRAAQNAFEKARRTGGMVVSGPVYAELMGLPSRIQPFLDSFFRSYGIDLDWSFDETVWRTAGTAFQSYVQRRVASSGSFPRRILTDFLIGAHAQMRGYTLLTLDKKLYEAAFPGIHIATF